MPGPVFLAGETVDLHPIEEEDLPFVQRLINDERVRTTLAAYAPKNRLQEQAWLESHDDDNVRLLVCVDGDLVGTIGLKPPNEVWGTVEIGYMIDPDRWGNGYATEAVRLACGYAFRERRLNKVYATVYAVNPASARVLEKVGFQQEGTLRQHAFVDGEYVDIHYYGLLAEEFEP
ncbi:GNAT family N-acetyltransferase [Halorarius litoreus]|uniref:GNAT family N-acetyltransferase n=1 Tax=Halorarius litoreus TaxID=2962676 RepID=UPI0020CBBA97|nr:GNAT family protein [Halorarius litoreus]